MIIQPFDFIYRAATCLKLANLKLRLILASI